MRGVLVTLALAVASAAPVRAQTPPPAEAPPPVEYLSRFDFQVSMEHLSSEDRRFVWDANFGGQLDMVDYGRGRATFVANYQTILGNEFREFDPNQGNYTLEGSVSARLGAAEAAGVFHHVSRHLSDRPKRFPVDWNMIGGRIRGATVLGRAALRGGVDLRGVIQKSYVDYRWELESGAAALVPLRPRVAFVSTGIVRIVGVDGSRDRGTQYGYRAEGGVRLGGRGALLDLFVAGERRIDPYQLEFSTVTWLTVGFRISSPSTARMP
jgi:hypothetical protein